jgi:hypothetical protein
MDKEDFFAVVMVGLLLFVAYKIYKESDIFQLKCVVSTVDGDKYCVRERSNIQEASDLLAKTAIKMDKLVDYLKSTSPDDKRVKKLIKNFNSSKIVETLPTSEFTAYSENKGRKIAFCLNKKKENNNNLIDENTLMFVAIHEMGHITTESIGHDKTFWDNFKFLLEEAVKAKLYIPIDYKKDKTEYCGMTISDNPYFK